MCQRIKPPRHAPYGLLQPREIPTKPWESISMDFVTDLPESNGYDAIWVVVDRLTKMAHFIPCRKDMDTKQFIQLFLRTVFKHHGLPRDIVTDRGSVFTSDLWKEMTKGMEIRRKLSTAFHPQTDGQTERVNAIMEQLLRG